MKVFNKRAAFDYQLLERYEAGIALTGAEAKAVHTGHVNLTASHARFLKDELYLINANITVPADAKLEPTRSRKLLLHRRELASLLGKISQKKLTIVPVAMYTKGRLIKVEIALAKTKRDYQKRESLKLKDIQRDVQRELK